MMDDLLGCLLSPADYGLLPWHVSGLTCVYFLAPHVPSNVFSANHSGLRQHNVS
jgi:hypothetical protein